MVDKKKICMHISLEATKIHMNNSHSRIVVCLLLILLYLFELLSCFSNIDMSQAEQVPEDMPAYLNDEPVGTGKPLASNTHCFLYSQSSSSGHAALLCCVNWEYDK